MAPTDFVKTISNEAINSQNAKSRLSASTGEEAQGSIINLGFLFSVLAIITTLQISRDIARSICKLKIATKKVAVGEFEDTPELETRDELGELSFHFYEMAKRLKQLERIHVDMSPLTGMPGNIAIEKSLRKVIDDGRPFALCHFNLDNFKAFGDQYWYAHGSEVIKMTAQIISEAFAKFGTNEDCRGHIGDDDFVVITAPDRYESICCIVIEDLFRPVPYFYSPKGRELGFIMGKTHKDAEMAFPLMSISIGVIKNRERELKDTLQAGEIVAELKECAKSRCGSNIVADKVEWETP